MKQLLPILFLCAFTSAASAQEVISAEPQEQTLAFTLNLLLPINVRYDVNNYKITYTTTDAFGRPDTATGLLSYPEASGMVLPLVVYNHGTIASDDEAPSNEGVLERLLIAGFAARGYVALAPDYLGHSGGDGPHPYLHADTEASAGRDMVIAAKKWLVTQDIEQNEQLFVTGYSQGGHASAALHRDVETVPGDDELTITAAAHLSAPFNVTAPSPLLLGLSDVDTRLLAFFLNTAISYNFVYNLYGGLDGLIKEPYLTQAQRFVDEEIDLYRMGDVIDSLRRDRNELIGGIFSDAFVTDVLDNDADLVNAYESNEVYDWAPQSPTLIYYCNADMTVSPTNSILADSVMRMNGATDILLVDGGALNHGDCAIPAALRTLAFFEELANRFPVSLGAPVTRPELTLVPNPVAAGATVRLGGLPQAAHTYVVYDFSGRALLTGQTEMDGTLRLPSSLSGGGKVLRVGMADGTSVVRRFVVK